MQSGSIQSGFKIREVDEISNLNPRSPYEGTNSNFRGLGEYFPRGGPEIVIDSISTVDTDISRVILELKVE